MQPSCREAIFFLPSAIQFVCCIREVWYVRGAADIRRRCERKTPSSAPNCEGPRPGDGCKADWDSTASPFSLRDAEADVARRVRGRSRAGSCARRAPRRGRRETRLRPRPPAQSNEDRASVRRPSSTRHLPRPDECRGGSLAAPEDRGASGLRNAPVAQLRRGEGVRPARSRESGRAAGGRSRSGSGAADPWGARPRGRDRSGTGCDARSNRTGASNRRRSTAHTGRRRCGRAQAEPSKGAA